MNPKVSVIMPVYNAEEYLAEAIESILNQTFKDFEFLIFDDCSTDSSLSIIEKYQKDDSRIVIFSSPGNYGYLIHLNKGLELAKGEYIARMDADDISMPQRFERQLHHLDSNPNLAALGTWYEVFGVSGQNELKKMPVGMEEIISFAFNRSIFGHPTVMFRKNILEKYNLRYDVFFYPAEDFELWNRMLMMELELDNIPEVLLKYRSHDQQISQKKRNVQQEKSLITKKRYFYWFFEYPQNSLENHDFKLEIQSKFNEIQKNDHHLKKALKNLWVHEINSIYQYKPKYLRYLFSILWVKNYGLTNTIKFIIKCILSYQVKIK